MLHARCCRELLLAGYKVRAAARDVAQAKANTDIAVQFGLLAPDQLSRLSWVEMDLEEPDSIPAAIGNASRVSGSTISSTTSVHACRCLL